MTAAASVASRVNRRVFLKTSAAAGGGLLVALYLPEASDALLAQEPGKGVPIVPSAYLKIAPNDTVTIVSNHSEMGQGIYTSLAMLMNEELEADWSKVRVESAPVDAVYNNLFFGIQGTGGSTTVASEWERFRKIGAAARLMLVQAAAQQWNVKPADCRVAKGVVMHPASLRKATYGSLAEAASRLPVPNEIPLKSEAQFTQVGKPTRRLDTPSKVDGSAQFGLDVNLPGMLTAVVERPPVFGAKVVRFDATDAEKVPGVKAVVQVPSGVAVIAEGFWAAKVGREKLKVTWDEGENEKLSTEQMLADFAALSASPGAMAKKTGARRVF